MSLLRLAPLGVALGVALLSACTVRPMYSDVAIGPGAAASSSESLRSVIVSQEATRPGLETRNHLIFLLNGGAAQTAQPRYTLQLRVVSAKGTTALVQTTRDSEPTAGNIRLTSNYVLTDMTDGKVVARGTRSVTSSYDVPLQEFAALRAVRNAEDRAARELAELMRHVVAQDLSRLGQG